MATATIKEIKEKAQEVTPMEGRPGCFTLKPPVALRQKNFSGESKIMHCDAIDDNGEHPDNVHFIEGRPWWSVKEFKLAYEKKNTMGGFIEELLEETSILEAKSWVDEIRTSACPGCAWNYSEENPICPEEIKLICCIFSKEISDRLRYLAKLGTEGRECYVKLRRNSYVFLRELWEKTKKQGLQMRLEDIDRINNY
jgi:hypothetical protein